MSSVQKQMKVAVALGVVGAICRASAQSPPMMGGGGGVEKIPDMAALMALDPPYVATENVEYTPLRAPASGPAVMDIGMGLIKTSATACAQECSDTDGCNMATWTGNVPDWQPTENCYLKTIAEPCIVPAEAETAEGFYLLMAQVDGCADVPGLAPNDMVPPPGVGPTEAQGPYIGPAPSARTAMTPDAVAALTPAERAFLPVGAPGTKGFPVGSQVPPGQRDLPPGALGGGGASAPAPAGSGAAGLVTGTALALVALGALLA